MGEAGDEKAIEAALHIVDATLSEMKQSMDVIDNPPSPGEGASAIRELRRLLEDLDELIAQLGLLGIDNQAFTRDEKYRDLVETRRKADEILKVKK